MACLCPENRNGRFRGWRIVWTGSDGKQKALRLGRVQKRNAEAIWRLTERLLESKQLGLPLDPETARWLERIDDRLADRLAKLGLAPARNKATLGEFLEAWLKGLDKAPSTKRGYEAVKQRLLEFFGGQTRLADIKPEQAEAFRQHLISRGYCNNTVQQNLRITKSVFKRGVDLGLIEKNPFSAIKVGSPRPAQKPYVTTETVERVLAYCPDHLFRLLVVLARYGGLRIPSEPYALTWADVNWEEGRLLVNSPKTGQRMVPLFPRVRQELETAFEMAREGESYIFPLAWRKRDLKAHFKKAIRLAGLEPWPKLWHSLRSSCETDLVRRYPLPVVAKWIGNSRAVAMKHYVDVTDEHFRQATQEDPWGTTENPGQEAVL